MAFQFYCPNGHLLQGHESQMGQQSQCPMCGAMFVVPVMNTGGAAPPQQQVPPPTQPAAQQQPAAPAKAAEPEKPPEPKVYHIACPNGHLLETPDDILGQQALCPYCNVQFELRVEDSEEFKKEQESERRRREEEMNERWVKYSIRAAIGVGVMFGLMIIWIIIKAIFAEQLKDVEAYWGPLGCGVLTVLIMWYIIRREKKSRKLPGRA